MRVYVAASSHELPRVERVMRALHVWGIRVYDWTAHVRSMHERGLSEAELSDEEAREHAEFDGFEVRKANALLFLAPVTTTRGAWFELGVAYSFGTPIIVSGPDARQSIFTRLAERIVDTDEEAIAVIAEMAKRAEAQR